ncbi:PD-(D/E)XK nuclease-like domain-containing protein [Roseovarius indicus]|uniref:PD-(D/E)XK nuclease-like domain-containing protein n=1 Tax=Roseovarius indicus TaxID=540747 RepID=UPI00405A3F70
MKHEQEFQPVGIYAGLSNAGYHGGPGYSKSTLDIVRRSLAHFKHAQDQREAGVEREETAAMRVGSAEHGILLEPGQFEKEFALPFDASEWPDALATVDDIKARLKEHGLPVSGKKADLIERLREADPTVQILDDLKAMHAEDSAGKAILTPAQWRDVRGMRDAAIEHPRLCKLLTDPRGKAELSAYWRDKATGLLCRCRPDLWVGDVVLDIKTTDDARASSFERSVEKFRYYVQAPFYLDGIKKAVEQSGQPLPEGLEIPKQFVFGAIEKKAPYLNAIYVLDPQTMEIGRREIRDDLKALADAIARDDWPGYSRDIQAIGLPEWRLRQEEIEDEQGVYIQ